MRTGRNGSTRQEECVTVSRRNAENVIAVRSCQSKQRPCGQIQVETNTTKPPSVGSSCMDSTHCVRMATRSEANCSSTVEQHHLKQRTWTNDKVTRRENDNQASRIQTRADQSLQSETDGDGLKSRILQEQSAQSDWWTLIEAGTATWTLLSVR